MERHFRQIYVCGSMRSGTTILQKVICLSPDVNPFGYGGRYLMEQMQLYIRYAGTDSVFIKDFFGGVDGFKAFNKDLVDSIYDKAWSNAGGPAALVLKSPELSFIIPEILEILGTSSRFVFSVREPKDTIASMVRAGERQKRARLSTMLARLGRDIDSLCGVYNRAYEPILKLLDSSSPELFNRFLFTKYEDLVTNPERTQLDIYNFCELSSAPLPAEGKWRVSRKTEEIATHPKWSTYLTGLSGRPISASSIGTFDSVLSPSECARIQRKCKFICDRFGYN